MPITTPWETIEPTIDGTLGNGTIRGRVRRMNGVLFFQVVYVLGSTSVMGSSIYIGEDLISNPLWVPAGPPNPPVGAASVAAVSGSTYRSGAALLFASNITETGTPGACDLVAGPVFSNGFLQATVPFTWAAGDYLVVAGTTEAFDN